MGQEVHRASFTEADFAEFRERLAAETARLGQWFAERRFSRRAWTAGFELEAWLVDGAGRPSAINDVFLERLDNDLVVPELSRFNVEVNGSPTSLRGRAFSRLTDELDHTWASCTECAAALDASIVAIGILPTVEADALHLGNMSSMARYAALNAELLRQREGAPFELRIDGRERLRRTHPDLMLEAATTSFQIHLQVRQRDAVRLYNAAQAVSGVLVAVSANAPYLFGHDLWDETRVPLFEQSVAAGERDWQRVAFGNDYVHDSFFELYEQNLEHYPVLLPELQDTDPDAMAHLRFHNGTIWRWNRPLIGFDHDGRPHLRIEHRAVPAGPTIADAIANAALFYGLVAGLGRGRTPIESRLPFVHAKQNFYAGARDGLDAQLHWPGADGTVSVSTLVLEELLPLAERGLARLGIPAAEIDEQLGVIRERVARGMNGARWQRAWVARHGRDPAGLTRAYLERQATGAPVHRWAV